MELKGVCTEVINECVVLEICDVVNMVDLIVLENDIEEIKKIAPNVYKVSSICVIEEFETGELIEATTYIIDLTKKVLFTIVRSEAHIENGKLKSLKGSVKYKK